MLGTTVVRGNRLTESIRDASGEQDAEVVNRFVLCCRSFTPPREHMPPRKSPRKRRRSGSDTSGNDQEGKRKKKVPHQSKIDDVFQELLNMLAPATSESLKDFNDWEREEGRRGVVPLHIYWLERKLPQLRTTAAEGIDTKLDDINSFLEEAQVAYEDYIGDPGTGNQIVRRHVKASLGSVVRCIKEAKEMLPGLFSH